MKNIIKLFLIVLLLNLNSCTKEVEVPKEVIEIQDNGIVIVKESNQVELQSIEIMETQQIDVRQFEEQDYPIYQIELEGEEEDVVEIVPGATMYLPFDNGIGGEILFISEVEIKDETSKKASPKKATVGATIIGVHATLDMHFNYQEAKVTYSTKENRAKRNSSYINKLNGDLIGFLPEDKFKLNTKLPGLDVEIKPEKLINFKFGQKIWSSGESYIRFDGNLSIHPAFDFYMHYNPGLVKKNSVKFKRFLSLLEALAVPDNVLLSYKDKSFYLGNLEEIKFNLFTDIDRDISIDFKLDVNGLSKNILIPLASFTFPTTHLSAQVETFIDIDFEVLASMDLNINKKLESDVEMGMVIKNDERENNDWHYKVTNRQDSKVTLSAEVELATGIKLRQEIEVYVLGVIGPEFVLKSGVEAKAGIGQGIEIDNTISNSSTYYGWNFNLDFVESAQAKFNLSALHIDELSLSFIEFKKFETRKNLYSAPHSISIISGNNQEGYAGRALTERVKFGVYDSKDALVDWLPVPIFFNDSLNGHYGRVALNPVATTKGLVDIEWSLDKRLGAQSLEAYLVTSSGSQLDKVQVDAMATEAPPNNPPTAVSLNQPANGASAVNPYDLFEWQAAIDPEGDEISYEVLIGTTNDPTQVYSGNYVTPTSFSTTPTFLDFETTYYWKVRAIDTVGDTSESAVWSFTTAKENQPPTVPALQSPSNGATGQGQSVNLRWAASSDPDGDSLYYQLFFGTDAANLGLSRNNITSNSIGISSLTANTTYYWQIRTIDTKGNTATSPVWEFTTEAIVIENKAPSAPVLNEPQNGSLVGINVNSEVVTLTWEKSIDPEGDDITYEVYFGSSSNPPLIESNVTAFFEEFSVLTYYWYTPDITSYGTYYWKIRAKDSNGNYSDSEVRSFTIKSPDESTGGVYEGNLSLTSQAQIDSFNYKEVTGSLTIQESISNDILNLNGLNSLSTLGGDLKIRSNDALTSLNELSNLISVSGDLTIIENATLTSLSGLSNLTFVNGDLHIGYNAALTSLNGLSNLISVGEDLIISYNAALNSLSGLSNLTSIDGDLLVFENNTLASLNTLSNLTSIKGSLDIYGSRVTSLDGLHNLTTVGKDLYIRDNFDLTSLDALSKISSLKGLSISGNSSLASLDGLHNLASIHGDVIKFDGTGSLLIRSNDALTSLNGLSNLTSVSDDLDISGNNVLTSFCGISQLINNGQIDQNEYFVESNAFNPTYQDIIDGNCSQ